MVAQAQQVALELEEPQVEDHDIALVVVCVDEASLMACIVGQEECRAIPKLLKRKN